MMESPGAASVLLAWLNERVERFKARGKRYEVRDSIVPGLRLRVAADGARTGFVGRRVATGVKIIPIT